MAALVELAAQLGAALAPSDARVATTLKLVSQAAVALSTWSKFGISAAHRASTAMLYSDAGKASQGLFELPVHIPDALADVSSSYSEADDSVLKMGGAWEFWVKWYRRALSGTPLPWDLQEQIALIPNDIWQVGPKMVAEEIARIEAAYLAGSVAEEVTLSERGRLTLILQPIREAEHLSYLLGSVEDALELAIDTGNEVTEESYQARLIRRTLSRYANDPQRIEINFERAKASLLEGIAADDLPASPANRDLIQSLADAAGSIRESNPDIARNRDRLNRIRLAEISPDQAARIADVADAVAEVSEDFFKEELAEGIRRLPGVRRDDPVPDAIIPFPTAERNVALERRDVQMLLMARLAKTWLYLKGFDRAELARVMNQPEVQLVGLIGSLASIVGLVAYF